MRANETRITRTCSIGKTVPSKKCEWNGYNLCICVLGASISSLSSITLLEFRTVPTMCYFLFFIFIAYIFSLIVVIADECPAKRLSVLMKLRDIVLTVNAYVSGLIRAYSASQFMSHNFNCICLPHMFMSAA